MMLILTRLSFLFLLCDFGCALSRNFLDTRNGSDSCSTKLFCSECIQTAFCDWCVLPVTAANQQAVPMCQNRDVSTVLCKDLRNPKPEVNILNDDDFRKGGLPSTSDRFGTTERVVQIKPQRVKMLCRIGEDLEVKVSYKRAEDYPVDLYYLMDLSNSMSDDKETLSKLGSKLVREMRSLTSDFRVGFGSFVDKVVMPFTSTVPRRLIEPCTRCAAPYGFKHHLTLGTDGNLFADRVSRARISGNLDSPEGSFDAIVQAIVCTEQIGWRPNARHLLVLSTDAKFQQAGVGKFGGIVIPNDGQCHLDSEGNYDHSLLLDFPSVSQISQTVKDHQINLIFAVTNEHRGLYDALSERIQGASAGTLSVDSSNVIKLIKDEYHKIRSSVELRDNATSPVKISYFSKCTNASGRTWQTSRCEGLTAESEIEFTAVIKVTKCPEDPAQRRQIIKIEPVGVNESMIIELEIICNCDCEIPGNDGFVASAADCSNNGDLKCGVCDCHENFRGRNCECDASQGNIDEAQSSCKANNRTEIICSNSGECVCGECRCHARMNPKEIISGRFCECDNFSCYKNSRDELCSGQGECVCGKCVCRGLWTGRDCSCMDSTESCSSGPDRELCSGRGKCVCNRCVCDETSGGNRYSGRHCQRCLTCPEVCGELKHCVQCQIFGNGLFGDDEDACKKNCTFQVQKSLEALDQNTIMEDEQLCILQDEKQCLFQFAYRSNSLGDFFVRVQETVSCPEPLNVVGIVGGVIGAIVALGLLTLILWKILTMIHDSREYARFEEERSKAGLTAGSNPLYKGVVSNFSNPAYSGKVAQEGDQKEGTDDDAL